MIDIFNSILTRDVLDLMLMRFLGFIQSGLVIVTILNIAGVHYTPKRLFITITVIYLPYGTLVSLFDISMWTIYTWVLLTVLAYRFSFKQPWIMSLFLAVLANFIGIIQEYTFMLVHHLLPTQNLREIILNSFAIRILPTIFYISLYLITRKLNITKHHSIEHFAKIYWILYFLAFGFLADLTFFFLFDAPTLIESLPSIIITILFLVFFLHTLWYLGRLGRTIALNEELKTEKLYSESLSDATDEISGFRHDFANIIQTTKGYLRREDLDGLTKYIESLSAKTVASMMVEEIDEIKKIPILYGILVSKISYAKENDIDFQIAVRCDDIDLRFCSTVDYSRMIGIFLDNAFEYAIESNLRTVLFDIRTMNGTLTTLVRNLCNSDIDLERIYERGYSTKEPPSGEGLYFVHKILEKYEQRGEMLRLNTEIKHGMFHQELMLE